MAYDLVAKLSLKDNLTAKIKKATKGIEQMKSVSDKASSGFKKLENSAKVSASKISKEFKKAYEDAKPDNAFKGAGDLGKVMTGIGLAGAGALTGATYAAMSFEDAFSGVRKTVNATEEEFAALKQGIRDMTKVIPASHEEIAGVAEAAGQLGIKTGAILKFTETMVNLGVATNLSAEDAASSLARFANITQMSQNDFDKLGSTVVALGNNLATTESEIVEMALRIAGAGHQVGLTEAKILSMSGALSSVGIEAEAGGSAISKVMIDIAGSVNKGGKKLELFAKTSGMSTAQFKKAFKDDAAGAIVSFVEGLGKLKAGGKDVFGTLDELGLSEIRVRDALLRASGAGDLFRNSLELGTNAWKDNIALTNEAAEKYKTAKSQMQLLKNTFRDAMISAGEIVLPDVVLAMKSIKGFIEKLNGVSPAILKTVVRLTMLFTALMLIAGPALLLISWLPAIAAGFATLGTIANGLVFPVFIANLVKAAAQAVITGGIFVTKLVASMAMYVLQGIRAVATIALIMGAWVAQKAVMIATAVATHTMTAAQWALNVAMSANPIGLVIALVIGLVAGLVLLYRNSETARAIMTKAFEGMRAGVESSVEAIKVLWGGLVALFKNPIKTTVSVFKKIAGGDGDGGTKTPKAKYHGIESVPYNGYVTRLHKGERVQTAQEVRAEGKGGGLTLNIAKLADEIIIREENDIEKLANALAIKILQAKEAGA